KSQRMHKMHTEKQMKNTLHKMATGFLTLALFFAFEQTASAKDLTGSAAVLKGYLEGVKELAKDNFEKGLAGLKSFDADLKNLSDAAVAKEKEAVQKELAKALESKDIRALRGALKSVSEKVYELHQKLGSGKMGVNAYTCPMANGKWLSLSKNVENPYYGSSMFDCGEKLTK
ncbi:MAG: DUF3347 domain-containing protein, partial [Spirochaetia bacterium]|nr:DUF3347 domain-containing protein [Spirochaetia bacterium]